MLGHRVKESISYSLRSNIEKIIDYAFGCNHMIGFNPIAKDLTAHCAVVSFDCQEYRDYIKYKNDINKLKEIAEKRYAQFKRKIKQLTGTFDENRIYVENDSPTAKHSPDEFNYVLRLDECLKIYNKEKTKRKDYKAFDTTNLDDILVNKKKCMEFENVKGLSNLEKERIKDFIHLIQYNSFGIKNLSRRHYSPLYGVDLYRDNENYYLYVAVEKKHTNVVLNNLNNVMQNIFGISENPDTYALNRYETIIQYSISEDALINIIALCKIASQNVKTLLMKGE